MFCYYCCFNWFLIFFFLYVWMCVYVCMTERWERERRIGMCTWVYVGALIHNKVHVEARGRRTCLNLSLPFVWDGFYDWTCSFLIARLASQQYPREPPTHYQSAGILSMHFCIWLLHGSCDSDLRSSSLGYGHFTHRAISPTPYCLFSLIKPLAILLEVICGKNKHMSLWVNNMVDEYN